MVSSKPRPNFTPAKESVPILQEAGWAPGAVWTSRKSRPHRDSIPDRPVHISVAIPTELPDPKSPFNTDVKNGGNIYLILHGFPWGKQGYIYINFKRVSKFIKRPHFQAASSSASPEIPHTFWNPMFITVLKRSQQSCLSWVR